MDPSEYEDTVERGDQVLDAGALERLLQTTTFTMVDMTKEMDDLCMSIYSLKEVGEGEGQGLRGQVEEAEGRALKLSELKEDYVMRRKALTAKVKKFSSEFLHAGAGEGGAGEEGGSAMANACRDIVEAFKTEFDGLSALSKVAEGGFITLYRALRDLPNPAQVGYCTIEHAYIYNYMHTYILL
jgi:hypothetical protein